MDKKTNKNGGKSMALPPTMRNKHECRKRYLLNTSEINLRTPGKDSRQYFHS